jgi:uncharacterized protein YutD
MEGFQKEAKNHQKVESIADMKTFVEMYPNFKVCTYFLTKGKWKDKSCNFIMIRFLYNE